MMFGLLLLVVFCLLMMGFLTMLEGSLISFLFCSFLCMAMKGPNRAQWHRFSFLFLFLWFFDATFIIFLCEIVFRVTSTATTIVFILFCFAGVDFFLLWIFYWIGTVGSFMGRVMYSSDHFGKIWKGISLSLKFAVAAITAYSFFDTLQGDIDLLGHLEEAVGLLQV